METVRVGLVGSGFVAAIHRESFGHVRGAEVVAVASPTPGSAERFAAEHKIASYHQDYRAMFDRKDVDLVLIASPNDTHCEATVLAASAGKHVVVEKPMAPSLAECDRMIAACERAGVILGYAEELCFAPKYVRMKRLVDEGAVGRVHLVKQSEKHDGPHTPWFYDTSRSGGGVTFDMGCHAVEFFRWLLGGPSGKARVVGAFAKMGTYVHGDRTDGDDEAILVLDFEGGAVGLAEESWTKPGGMDDRAEVFGADGQLYADLLHGNALRAYSRCGYGYAVEKAGATQGWTFPIFEEAWNYGFPQEMQHFVDCVRDGRTPSEDGHDGRAVVEVIHALYASAAEGSRVALPFATDAARPIDHWKPRANR
ncbi:MAG TPA: Gfo/Idh/MocA family oxidoreductase [Isosphaeraceae bacterium]|jgi:predicted dehydrogenase|nr:Gfo/Idh/MocA family oxidoreductase [Isosphaeraceae bacterium]